MVKKWRRHTADYKFRVALDVSNAIRSFSNALEIWASPLRACIRKTLAGGQPHQSLEQRTSDEQHFVL